MSEGVLIAGIGNIFLSDDGFGPEVVRYLADGEPLPSPARLVGDHGDRAG
jgi:hydrogenase maturation protease